MYVCTYIDIDRCRYRYIIYRLQARLLRGTLSICNGAALEDKVRYIYPYI